jgi:hypothetical protein
MSYIDTDGICVYITLFIMNALPGKIAVLIADLFIFIILILAIVTWIPGLILISVLFESFSALYLMEFFWQKDYN